MAKTPNGSAPTMAKTPNDSAPNLASMSIADLEAMLKNKKAEQSKQAAERGLEAKADVEKYCQEKWGLPLHAVYLASETAAKPKTYLNPDKKENPDGKTYPYSGRGKVPKWLQIGGTGKDAKKPNPAFEVRAN